MRDFIYNLRGYGLAFTNLEDAERTVKDTWSADVFTVSRTEYEDEGAVVYVISREGSYTTVHIEKVPVLTRSTHL